MRDLRGRFEQWERDRRDYETRWADNLRAFKGRYKPEIEGKLHPNRSRVYFKLTRSKVISATARLGDLLFPKGDRNWEIRPTPVPELPDADIARIVDELTGQGVEPTEDRVLQGMREMAAGTANRMSEVIEDQLAEMDYGATGRRLIWWGITLGTGVLKGPTSRTVVERKLVRTSEGFAIEPVQVVKPFAEVVPLWDCYPDLHAGAWKDSEGMFQEHLPTKIQLQDFAANPKFRGDVIQRYIADHPDGDARVKEHEQTRREMDQRANLGGTHRNRYRLLEFWGVVDSVELQRMLDEQRLEREMPPGRDVQALVWMLGDKVIRAVPNPFWSQRIPYHLFTMEHDDDGLLGPGLPEIVEDSQSIANTGTRTMLDNAAITSGAQFSVDKARLVDGDDPQNVYPFKVWVFDSAMGDKGAGAPFQVHEIPNNVAHMLSIVELAKSHADEETALPSVLAGGESRGADRTLGGLSIKVGSSNLVLKDIVKNFDDDITDPFISAMYDWNMQFNPRDDIKGDMKIVARGSTALIAKEVRGPAAELFAQNTLNDRDSPHVNARGLLRLRAESNDLPVDQVLLPEDQVERQGEAEEQALAEQAESQRRANEKTAAEAAHEAAQADESAADTEEARARAEKLRAEASHVGDSDAA